MNIDRRDRAVFTEQLERRRRGRPRSAKPTWRVTLDLPQNVYDELCRHAAAQRTSLHALLCRELATRARVR